MLVWGLGVSSVDNVVKPWLISQGSDMPFLLILFGVLGGALTFGFIGVFLGPTLLAVGYRLVVEWHPALGVVGLPWASFAGSFAAQNILGTAGEDYKKYYRYFSNRRHFSLPSGLAKIIGKSLVFSLTNAWAKFYQVDSHRKTEEMRGEF